MTTPTLELTYRIEWDKKDVPDATALVERVLTERLLAVAIRSAGIEVVDESLVLVRLLNETEPNIRAAKEVLGMSGFALRCAASLQQQESYLRTERVPDGYKVWKNAYPMSGEYAAYGDSVLLEDPPLLTAQFLTAASAWDDTTEEHGEGGVLLIDFDETGERLLDFAAKELFGLRPRGLMGATFGRSLRSLVVVASDRFRGRLLLKEPTAAEARGLAGHLSSGYLPARLGGIFEGRFEEGSPHSERWTGPPLDLESPGGEIAQRYASLSYVYAQLAEFSRHGVLEEGLSAIEDAMKTYGRTRDVDRALLETIRWMGTLLEDSKLDLPRELEAITVAEDRSALAVISDHKVRVLRPLASPAWSEGIPLSSPVQGVEFLAPDRVVVRSAAEGRDATLEGAAVEVVVVEQEGPVSVRVAQCLEPGPILGKSRNGRFIAYRTGEDGKVGILDLDSVSEGRHATPLHLLTLEEPYSRPSRASISPDGARMLVTTYDPAHVGGASHQQGRLFQLVDSHADEILGTIAGGYLDYFVFSWSPDARWIACHEEEKPIPDWDVPVGSTLRSYVRLYDGLTAEEKWSQEATDRGDFGWTADGLVRCGGMLWDARTGDAVRS